MNYYIISGEASGDLHASNLIKGLKKQDKDAHFRCWGGDLMEREGAVVVKHYRELAFMGFSEVVMNLKTILGNIRFCKEDILEHRPDVLILVDYPGFNLRIAKFAKENNIRVFYYISPQIWAWKQSRVKIIKQYVEKMFVILPFEKGFYSKFSYDVDFVGHPLLDAIEQQEKELAVKSEKPLIVLLPGSRKQEIRVMLPLMLSVQKDFPAYVFAVAAAPSIEDDFYRELTSGHQVEIVKGKTYALLKQATAALVTSGTATLETALFGVPEVVCYKGGKISYEIAKRLIKVKYISLVNLIMDREIVKELIQDELNPETIKLELDRLLDENIRKKMLNDYAQLKQVLGGSGASEKAAQLMYAYLQEK
jgi:lipid-A-disaccharide synthase